MTINITNFAAKIDEVFQVTTQAKTFAGSVSTDLDSVVNEFTTESVEVRSALNSVLSTKKSINGSLSALIANLGTVVSNLVVELAVEDDASLQANLPECRKYLIEQFETQSAGLEENTVSVSVTLGGSNTGTGAFAATLKNKYGQTSQLPLAETISVTCNGAGSYYLKGQRAEGTTSPLWPAGSGITSTRSRSTNLISNNTFSLSDSVNTSAPASWIVSGTVGTRLVHSSEEVQTIVIAGTPTSGVYQLLITVDGYNYQSAAIAYNAQNSDVQTAISAIPGLGSASVVTTGTTPNFTHTVTFNAAKNPSQFTSTNTFNAGTISHATTTAGSSDVARGSRSLQFTGDGSEQTAIYQSATLVPNAVYSVSMLVKQSGTGAGVIAIDLVDGIGGTVITDDQSGSNQIATTVSTISNSAFDVVSGFFITPKTLPSTVYLRIWQSTALASGQGVFVDDVQLTRAQQTYTSGPYVEIIEGATKFGVEDTASITVANNYAGSLITNLGWAIGTFDNDVKNFPAGASGDPGIASET